MTYCCPGCGYPSKHINARCPMNLCYETASFIRQDEWQLALDMARDIEKPSEDCEDFVLPQLNVIGDKLHPFYDYACGERIDSKSQRKRIYKKKGLRLKSVAEHKRQYPEEFKNKTFQKRLISYGGQKKYKSSAEREGVKTGTGQRIV